MKRWGGGGQILGSSYAVGKSTYRPEEHTSELQKPIVISYAVLRLKKKKKTTSLVMYVYQEDV